jgi:hypothetical protein
VVEEKQWWKKKAAQRRLNKMANVDDPFIALEKMLASKGRSRSSESPVKKVKREEKMIVDIKDTQNDDESDGLEVSAPSDNDFEDQASEDDKKPAGSSDKRKVATVISFGVIKDSSAAQAIVDGSPSALLSKQAKKPPTSGKKPKHDPADEDTKPKGKPKQDAADEETKPKGRLQRKDK